MRFIIVALATSFFILQPSYASITENDSTDSTIEWLIEVQAQSQLDRDIQRASEKSSVASRGGNLQLVRRLFSEYATKRLNTKLSNAQRLSVVKTSGKTIASLISSRQILRAEPNNAFKPLGAGVRGPKPSVPNDTHLSSQWHLSKTGFDQVWNTIPELRDLKNRVLVFVADTWIDANHSDFKSENFLSPQPPMVGLKSFHGTHVTSIISASTANSHGISGAVWDASLVPLEVCGLYTCDTSRIVEAIALSADFRPELEVPRVINLSLGGATYSYQMAHAIEYAQSKDVLVVAAAGNSFLPALAFYPASYPDVVSVGATDQNDEMTVFSNYGPRSLTIVAPGKDILGAVPVGTDYFADIYGFRMVENDFAYLDGTSMAAPLVTAAAAMVRAFKPELKQDEVRRVLTNAGTNIPAPGYPGFNYKRLDIHKALLDSVLINTTARTPNQIEEEVIVDLSRTCHVKYNPTYPCENCIMLNGHFASNSDTEKTRIRWMFFNILPVFPNSLHFTEVTRGQDFYTEIPYYIPEYERDGLQITDNYHFLTAFVEDRDSTGEIRHLRQVRFSNGETFFDIGRSPCP